MNQSGANQDDLTPFCDKCCLLKNVFKTLLGSSVYSIIECDIPKSWLSRGAWHVSLGSVRVLNTLLQVHLTPESRYLVQLFLTSTVNLWILTILCVSAVYYLWTRASLYFPPASPLPSPHQPPQDSAAQTTFGIKSLEPWRLWNVYLQIDDYMFICLYTRWLKFWMHTHMAQVCMLSPW